MGQAGLTCSKCRAGISFDTTVCPNCGFTFGPPSRESSGAAAIAAGALSPKRAPASAVLKAHWDLIAGTGLLFCIPSAAFFAMLIYGKGGETGGAIALVLGLIAFCFGLPWNIALAIAWGMIAKALDHPAWLGDTTSDWAALPMLLITSIVGAFINGAFVGWTIARRRPRR